MQSAGARAVYDWPKPWSTIGARAYVMIAVGACDFCGRRRVQRGNAMKTRSTHARGHVRSPDWYRFALRRQSIYPPPPCSFICTYVSPIAVRTFNAKIPQSFDHRRAAVGDAASVANQYDHWKGTRDRVGGIGAFWRFLFTVFQWPISQ